MQNMNVYIIVSVWFYEHCICALRDERLMACVSVKGQNASHGNVQNVIGLFRHCYHKYDTELVTMKYD